MKAVLHNPQQAKPIIDSLWLEAKNRLLAGYRLTVELKQVTRSNEASAKFHAMCGDFAKSGVEWAGKRRSLEEWKVLLISGHSVATKQGAEVVPGLENELVNIRESSAKMSQSRMNSLIEYAYATGVNLGVRFTAPEWME